LRNAEFGMTEADPGIVPFRLLIPHSELRIPQSWASWTPSSASAAC
jgi:hypothetical protein